MTTPRIEETLRRYITEAYPKGKVLELLDQALTQAHQAGVDEERERCLRWIGTKSAISNLFNGNNKNLKVNGQDEYKNLIDRIKSGD